MTTVLATIIVLGILVFVHELGHFLLAKLLRVRVEAFSLGFPPKLLHKKIGDTDYRLSVVPLGGYVKLLGENPNDEVPPELEPYSFMHRPLWQRFSIVVAGPIFNLLFAVVALFLVFALTGIPYLTTEIGEVKPESPAARAGLQKGDRVLTVSGQPVARWEELSQKIRAAGEQPVILTLNRGDQLLEFRLTPQVMETADIFGGKVSAVIIGVSASEKPAVDQVGPLQALSGSTFYTFRLCVLTVQSVGKLVTRDAPLSSLGGPILIAQVAGKQAELGVSYLVQFMAVLSINLFLLNLLPIPVLDGGHLFFFAVEALRGKPVALKHREVAQGVGLMMLLALMLLVFYQDIIRLVGPQH